MRVEFEDADLERLEFDPGFDAGLAQQIVRAFRKRMNMIRAAPDERVFRKSRGLRYEKLRGTRKGQHAMRLNVQYRLLIRVEGLGADKTVVVLGIEDYH
jgi:proteic killer suppression protein